MISEAIFRQYDIRGTYGLDLTEEAASSVGWAFAALCRERTGRPDPLVAIGRDARLSSPSLARAFAAAVTAAGGRILDLGLCPSPLVYFAASERADVDGFASVTGSHNPPGENGLKLGIGPLTLHSGDIQELGRRAREFAGAQAHSPGVFHVEKMDIVRRYRRWSLDHFARLGETLGRLGRKVTVAVDSGNGTAGPVLPPILTQLGFSVVELFSEPDGNFPNHHPDPTLPETLTHLGSAVQGRCADLGMAFDGDADRIGVLDESGRVIWGDLLLLLLARDLIRTWREAGGGGEPPLVISEVKASEVLYDGVRAAGGRVLMWKTGHSLIKAKMRETGASLAGEMSGHLFFADRYRGYDDAIYAAMRILEVYVSALSQGRARRFSDLLADVPRVVNTPEIRVPCPDKDKFAVVSSFGSAVERLRAGGLAPRIMDVIDIDGVRVRFENGWGLVRASNTQPVIVMRFEASDEDSLQAYRKVFDGALASLLPPS